MWAIIKTGGKQYKVTQGETISVDKLETSGKDNLVISDILALGIEGSIKLGTPTLKDVKVQAKLVKNFKDKKVRVVKFKSKSRYTRTSGHRHQKSMLLIEKIIA